MDMGNWKQDAGQTTVEYILLMAVMLSIAVAVMAFVKGGFQKFSQALVSRIAQPCAECQEEHIYPKE
ncbi:MAG TPA: hypothetical protein VJL87_03960 [Bdellovibrionota bacterium]|nr:hypothetical protein [Bdellovibrionota bacterium]